MNNLSEKKSIPNFTKGYFIALFATTIWATAAIFIRILSVNFSVPALVLAFWRDFLVFLMLLIGFSITRSQLINKGFGQLKFFIIYGFLLSLFNGMWTISVALNGAAISTVLVYCSAAFTAIGGWKFFGEKLEKLKILAIIFSLTGCVFVSEAYNLSVVKTNLLGIATGLLSGVAFAGYSLLGKISSQRGNNPWTTMVYIFGVASFFLLLYTIASSAISGNSFLPTLFCIGPSLSGWGVMLALAIGPGLVGYGFYLVSMTYLPASVANLIATLEPAITAILAYLFLGERLTTVQLLGSALIIVGVLILRISEYKKP